MTSEDGSEDGARGKDGYTVLGTPRPIGGIYNLMT